jgi:hypothetical protein
MYESERYIRALEAILLDEITAYETLLAIQQAEKRLLVAHEIEAFVDNLQAKEQTLRAIADLEDRRQTLVKQLAPLLHLPDTAISLQQLSTRMPEPHARTMRQYRSRLQRLLRDVQRSSGENAWLVRDSLVLIEEALGFLGSLLPTMPTYQPSGTFAATIRGRLLSGTV